jgi:FixJ family two-component response regulator
MAFASGVLVVKRHEVLRFAQDDRVSALNVRMISRPAPLGHSLAEIASAEEPVSKAATISIVDDDESVRAAMSSLVRSLSYDACEFASAEAFLASPRRDDTACLIVDVQMPGMSGLDLQDALNAEQRPIPIIFITALPADRVRERAEAGGAVGFFAKPVDSQKIIFCLDAVLKQPTP